ncbi:MAG: NhaC family Na+:H+ antiporter [Pseudohongiellaceae bacterium]|jgi:NhaC family Na+:H+ antiporter
MTVSNKSPTNPPSLFDALIPVITLIILLALSVYLFGPESSSGANQIALFIASGIAILIAIKNGWRWHELEIAIAGGVSSTVNAMLILLTVGALIGAWVISGTVPAMIYYGLKLIDPGAFYLTTCIVCALASFSIGSSWSVIGTVGLGLFGAATSLGISPEITAGAIISGAYFGDKMSPLSDTTNLAPAVAGTNVFTHIRHMMWTTVPSITIALAIYAFLDLGIDVQSSTVEVTKKLLILENTFKIGPHLLTPILVVLLLALRKFPALPAMMISTLAGLVVALIFQRDLLLTFMVADNLSDTGIMVKGIWTALFNGYTATTVDTELNELLAVGGMSSILSTIWLIISALTFGSIMDRAGLLQRLITGLMSRVKSSGGLIVNTVLTCIGVNIVAADQYISIVLPARMYQLEFKKRNLAPENLSRVLEDAGTVTSALIPWNTCGAFIYGILGISAFAYAPYCFFNLISPVMSSIYGLMNFKITPIALESERVEQNTLEADSKARTIRLKHQAIHD